jgi:hypothetical protein
MHLVSGIDGFLLLQLDEEMRNQTSERRQMGLQLRKATILLFFIIESLKLVDFREETGTEIDDFEGVGADGSIQTHDLIEGGVFDFFKQAMNRVDGLQVGWIGETITVFGDMHFEISIGGMQPKKIRAMETVLIQHLIPVTVIQMFCHCTV